MPEPSNMHSATGISSFKFAYDNEIVACSSPNSEWLNHENTYQLPGRPPTTMICVYALVELNA